MTDMSAQDLPGVGPDLSDKLAQIGVHTVLDVRLSSKDALQRACGVTKGEALPVLSQHIPMHCLCEALTRVWHPMGCPSLVPACLQFAVLCVCACTATIDTLQAACGATGQKAALLLSLELYVWFML